MWDTRAHFETPAQKPGVDSLDKKMSSDLAVHILLTDTSLLTREVFMSGEVVAELG